MSYGSQSIAGVLLGTPLAFAAAGLYAQLGPAEPSTNFMVALFLAIPVWLAIMIWTLKRTRATTAWIGLVLANALAASVVCALRFSLQG